MVYQLEQRFNHGEIGADSLRGLDQVSGRVGRLARFHEAEAGHLRARIEAMRLIASTAPFSTALQASWPDGLIDDGDGPPF